MRAPRSAVLAAALASGLLLAPGRAAAAELPPGHRIDQIESCLTCHDLAIDARVMHRPVAEGQCSACHNPHVARFAALLKDQPVFLCRSCHDDLQAELAKSVVHPPVAEGRCAACHEPHGGDHDGLLLEDKVELCRGCHQEVAEWEKRPVQHSPFRRGRCAECHDPHAAELPGLALGKGAAICVRCHPASQKFRADHAGYPVQQSECQQCHDPHASTRAGLFRDQLHPPFEEGECTTCHRGGSSGDPLRLVASEAQLCGECHEDQVRESREAPFPHVSAGGGDCSLCHNPHTGTGEGLLREEITKVCTSCHDPGGASSGGEGRVLSHGEGVDCSACHAPHGGARPLLLAEEPVALCGGCHAHQHGITHPLGEQVRDPRTGSPMTCLSCHGMHFAGYKMYLHASDERDLCIGCHKEIGGRGGR